MQRKPVSWFSVNANTAQSPLRLFVLPFAGGGTAVFRQWSQRLPGVDVVPIRLPGREMRISEPPYSMMEPLIDALATQLQPMLDRPYALFGHSMGALIAYELAHRLRETQAPQPLALFASAFRSPERKSRRIPMHNLPSDELLRELKDYGGLPDAIFDVPEILKLMLPTIRADFSILETYTHRDREPLDLPIHCFHGVDDHVVMSDEMNGWEHKTRGECRFHEIDGDHFFIATHEQELLGRIGALLHAAAPSRAAALRA
jgi:surfactin synthase thioesterase subunit